MWLLPSKARPASLARFFGAFEKTGGSTPGLVIVDHVDWSAHVEAYETIALPIGWSWRITDGVTQGDKLREIWVDVENCAWLGLIGDDCVPETTGWDRALVGELDGSNFVHCNDGWQAPRRVGNCWIMAGDLVRAVGYIFPPGLHHLFVDDVWEELSRRVRGIRMCRMDVMVRHRHVMAGMAAADDTHRSVYGTGFSGEQGAPDRKNGLWTTDEATYTAWLAGDAERAAEAIRALRRVDAQVNNEAELQQKRMARVAKRSVLFALPVHDKFEAGCFVSWTETITLLERMKIRRSEQLIIGSSNLPKARNRLCAYFLAGDWDDLVFIDSDMEWPAGGIVRLLASDKPIIGAVGRRKCEELSWCTLLMPKGSLVNQDDMGALEVRRVGTGLLKISREAFETIMKARPDLHCEPADPDMSEAERALYHRFFQHGEADAGEDYFFCDLYRECGGQIWIDPTIKLGHTGTHTWFGTFGDELGGLFEVAEAA
jgi:glycosyltransferase involved in cell wall biosynthesis